MTAAADELSAKLEALIPAADFSELAKAIADAEKYTESDYTEESWRYSPTRWPRLTK